MGVEKRPLLVMLMEAFLPLITISGTMMIIVNSYIIGIATVISSLQYLQIGTFILEWQTFWQNHAIKSWRLSANNNLGPTFMLPHKYNTWKQWMYSFVSIYWFLCIETAGISIDWTNDKLYYACEDYIGVLDLATNQNKKLVSVHYYHKNEIVVDPTTRLANI